VSFSGEDFARNRKKGREKYDEMAAAALRMVSAGICCQFGARRAD